MILTVILTLFVFFFVLSVLVLIHEFGHFFVARKLGIKVEEFGFGFPPRAFGIKRGETLYSINWLPIGGFVKLYGEDEAGGGKLTADHKEFDPKKTPDYNRTFVSKTPWQRAAVVVAGVVMNALLAMVIYYVFLGISNFKTEILLIDSYKFSFANQVDRNVNETDTVVSYVSPNSPAQNLRINLPAEIITLNGQPVKDRETLIKTVNANKGKSITLTWKELKTGKTQEKAITPRKNPPKNDGALGVAFLPVAIVSYDTPLQKIISGIVYPIDLMRYNFHIMGKLFGIAVEKKSIEPVSQGVSGPIGIAVLLGGALQGNTMQQAILQLLNIAGMLSVSLAVMNVLPIPALDGGRLFFILIEAITRKKVPAKFENMAHSIGMALLLGMLLLITFKDTFQFLIKPFLGQ